ncbi:MAG: hypothetical protein ACRC3Y_02305 [Romboutsia sp.]|uniref:hypothetical protein n=1 Tax=Romboutsia sp. TaxID=1965302 RepID=UPI003F3DEC9F
MKKIFKSLLISMVMVFTMAATTFANPVTDLRDELLAIGVPSTYVGNVIEHLQKTSISDSQYKSIKKDIEKARDIIGDTKDLSKLSTKDKNSLQHLATKAGKSIGLNIKFSKNASGRTVVVATDKNGATILKMSTADIQGLVTNFNLEILVNVFESIVEFANNPDKGNFTPIGGELTQTATGYGNTMVLGLAMIAGACGIVVISKKQFA